MYLSKNDKNILTINFTGGSIEAKEGCAVNENAAVRTARLLRVLVYVALGVNILCLPCVPYVTLLVLFFREHAQIAYWMLLVAGFWVCGGCTAVILWQAKKILDTILAGEPFRVTNARAMNRAAAACWVITAAAVVRLGVETVMFSNPIHLFSYNTVLIPCFFMVGLLFKVMSALFRQAAELKEDQDLTI